MGKWLRADDLTGQRFGQWLVLSFYGYLTNWSKPKRAWLCQCTCGTIRAVREYALIKGLSTQCGCASVITGHSHGPEYRIYQHIKQRCLVPKCKDYPRYGGQGVTMCAWWQESFKNFFDDMGLRPPNCHSIDRFPDQNGGYWCGHCEECVRLNHPANCRWATPKEQARNRRNNNRVTLDGQTMTLIEHAERLGISKNALWARLYGKEYRARKQRESGIVPKPPILVTLDGISMTVSQHARRLGIKQHTLWYQLNKAKHNSRKSR